MADTLLSALVHGMERIGAPLTQLAAERIAAFAGSNPDLALEDVDAAFAEAKSRGARSWGYVEAVLRRRLSSGEAREAPEAAAARYAERRRRVRAWHEQQLDDALALGIPLAHLPLDQRLILEERRKAMEDKSDD